MKWLRSDSYSIPTVLAVGLHASIVVAGLVVIDFGDTEPPKPKKPPIVNATVVDVSQTIIGQRESEQREAQKQAAVAEEKRKDAEQNRKKEAERKALEDKQRQLAQAKEAKEKEDAQRKREDEQKRQAQEAEQKRVAQEAEAKRVAQEAEKKRLAEKEADDKKRKELERKAEADRLAEEKLKKQAEADRLAEQERKRQEEASRLAEQKKAEAAAAKAAAEEAKERAVAEAQMVQSISSLINNRVTAAWIRPPSARNNMVTQLRIHFLPTGEVMNAQVTKSSGDALFDQRAVDAVYKVRRIEELAKVDSYVFERNFRQVDLIFNPQDLRN